MVPPHVQLSTAWPRPRRPWVVAVRPYGWGWLPGCNHARRCGPLPAPQAPTSAAPLASPARCGSLAPRWVATCAHRVPGASKPAAAKYPNSQSSCTRATSMIDEHAQGARQPGTQGDSQGFESLVRTSPAATSSGTSWRGSSVARGRRVRGDAGAAAPCGLDRHLLPPPRQRWLLSSRRRCTSQWRRQRSRPRTRESAPGPRPPAAVADPCAPALSPRENP